MTLKNAPGTHRRWAMPGDPYYNNQIIRWKSSDTEDNFRTLRPGISIYDEHSFDYQHNEIGFRCDSMREPLQYPHRIVLAGCSVTEGIGLPVEHVWGYRLLEKLRSSLDDARMPYWCAARGAASQDFVARQIATLVPMLRPQAVVALLPDPCRRELFIDHTNQHWCPGDRNNTWDGFDIERHGEHILAVWNDEQIVHDAAKNITLMHSVCERYGTRLFWHMTDYSGTKDIYDAVRYQLADDVLTNHYESCICGGDIARDGMHGGPDTHVKFASDLWQEIGHRLVDAMTVL
jgi:hypothetical protein